MTQKKCGRCSGGQCKKPGAPGWVHAAAIILGILGLLVAWFFAPAPANGAEPTKPAVVKADDGGKIADKWCDIYLLKGRPKDMLVFNQEGQLVQDARHVYLWFQISTQQPVARVYRWPGLYRTPNATEEMWEVRHLEMIDAAEFHKLAETGTIGK